jgi:hypothetical protein
MGNELAIVEEAKALRITSAEDNAKAAGLCKVLKGFQAEIEGSYRPLVEKAHEAHKAILAELKSQLKPYEEGEKYLKGLMIAWDSAERERIAKARREAEEKARKEAEEAALAEAEYLEATGDKAGADAALSAPLVVAPVVVEAVEKAEGATFRELWSAELVDIRALCRAVADGVVPAEYVSANMPALNGVARMMKQAFAVPGARAVMARTVGVSR